jgi:hypothetical protein
MAMSRPIYVIGKQETAIGGTALMRIVVSEEHTSPITSDFSVVNIFSFYFFFIYGILS